MRTALQYLNALQLLYILRNTRWDLELQDPTNLGMNDGCQGLPTDARTALVETTQSLDRLRSSPALVERPNELPSLLPLGPKPEVAYASHDPVREVLLCSETDAARSSWGRFLLGRDRIEDGHGCTRFVHAVKHSAHPGLSTPVPGQPVLQLEQAAI